MLPVIDGLTVLTRLRENGNRAYVLILSARDQTDDRVRGLDLGADDYLVKPFVFAELLARIRALTRRQAESKSPKLEIGSLSIDTIGCNVSCNGNGISLTPSEYSLLEYLVRRCGRVFPHDQLIDRLYDSNTYVTKNAIEAHISQLRKKLKAAGAPDLIRTKRGFGYYVQN